jgi:triphosphoribosyl-dephospho-CoA synthase
MQSLAFLWSDMQMTKQYLREKTFGPAQSPASSANLNPPIGASRGIGNAIVQELLRRGARVMGAVRKPNGFSTTLVKASPKGLASLALKALLEEAELTPKPALVDGRGPGAQADLSLSLMRRSAHCLAPFFELMALTSLEQIPTQTLREELGTIGRWAEHAMLRCTGQVNTHRGAIWSLGLLVSAAAMGAASPEAIVETARQIACLPDSNAPKQQGQVLLVAPQYKVTGARAEAQAGFPSVIAAGLPRLHLSRQLDESETLARLNALLAIMTRLDDTCLLRRGGLLALKTAQDGAASILNAGGVATPEGWRLLQQLDSNLLTLQGSPEGSADMLSATIFLDYVSRNQELVYKGNFTGPESEKTARREGEHDIYSLSLKTTPRTWRRGHENQDISCFSNRFELNRHRFRGRFA